MRSLYIVSSFVWCSVKHIIVQILNNLKPIIDRLGLELKNEPYNDTELRLLALDAYSDVNNDFAEILKNLFYQNSAYIKYLD